MRHSFIALIATLLTGCATSQLMEVARHDSSAIDVINARAAKQRANVFLRGSQVPVDARKALVISDDSVRYVVRQSDFSAATPLADVHEIGFGSSGSGRRGALYGGLVGGLGIGLWTLATNEECSGDSLCLFEVSDAEAFGVGFLFGGLGGALLGGIIGSINSSPGVIYRFRGDTPQQMSVVIGMGPLSNTVER